MKKIRTLIFHDTFISKSGTERVNINMANIFEADIATAIWSANSFEAHELGFHGKIIELFHLFYGGWLGFLRMKLAFYFSRKITKNYDRVIFSNEALSAIHRVLPGTETIYYAHSLPHVLFDGHAEYMKSVPLFFHEFYVASHWLRKKMYLRELRKVDKILTNSRMNEEWLMKWSGRTDIIVVYPPVNLLRFRPQKEKIPLIVQEHNNVASVIEKEVKDYYVSPSRLKDGKCIDKIIHAFIHMPEKNLIVLYSPHDEQKQMLMGMARGCNNIFFNYEPNDTSRAKIIANAVATISLAKDENFSMVSIESMSCGIPMISVNDGPLKESIIHEKTGILLSKNYTIYDIMDTVRSMTPEKSLMMKDACLTRANDFSLDSFSQKLRSIVRAKEDTDIPDGENQ